MSIKVVWFIATTYHHHLLQIDDGFHPSLLQSR